MVGMAVDNIATQFASTVDGLNCAGGGGGMTVDSLFPEGQFITKN